jgi:hypothetical protein
MPRRIYEHNNYDFDPHKEAIDGPAEDVWAHERVAPEDRARHVDLAPDLGRAVMELIDSPFAGASEPKHRMPDDLAVERPADHKPSGRRAKTSKE